MGVLSKLVTVFLVPIVRALAKVVIEEWRRPVEGEMVGGGSDVVEDVNNSVDGAIDAS